MAYRWETLLTRYPVEAVETAAGRVGVRRAGAGADLVLLHGIGSGSGSWVYQLASLSDGWRVSAWDAPGYGDSDALPGEPDAGAYAAALAALLDALGVARCVLVGHSLGALIAARFAADHPDRVSTLVLADPAAGHAPLSPDERERRLADRLDRFDRLGPERHAEERAPALLSDDAPEEARTLVRWNMARLRRQGYAQAAGLLAQGDLVADAARIAVPGAVLCGAEDRITPPESCRDLAAAFEPAVPYYEIPGAGHASYIEAPERFDALLAECAGVAA